MHRIPFGRNSTQGSKRSVVFLMHGLTASSADWVLMGPTFGLGKSQTEFFFILFIILIETLFHSVCPYFGCT